MIHSIFSIKQPVNEPVLSYTPGSHEKQLLKKELQRIATEKIEIPIIIGGKEYRTGDVGKLIMPHNHRHELGIWHKANKNLIKKAIELKNCKQI